MPPLCDLVIDDVAYGGAGIGRAAGKTTFVPGGLPGETVRAEVVRERDRYCWAVLRAVLAPSPDRVAPVCPLALYPQRGPAATSPFCPGCAYQHAAYPRELAIKQRQLCSLLERDGKIAAPPVAAPAGAPVPLGYRNKVVLHASVDRNEVQLGYFQEDNRTVIDVPQCPLAHADINAQLAELRGQPGFFKTLREGMAVTFRRSTGDGTRWWRGAADAGATWLREDTCLGVMRVPLGSFFQIHPAMLNMLLAHVDGLVRASPCARVIDLYSGVGVFALVAAAAGIRRVVAVESDAEAVQAARFNAAELGLDGACEFTWLCGDARRQVPAVAARGPLHDGLVVADPPRSGLDLRVLQALASAAPAEIVYVSCAADTLARDLRRFREFDYTLQSARLFDMFPRTAHFEVVAHLRRNRPA